MKTKVLRIYILDPGLQEKSGSNFDVVKKAIIFLKKQGYKLFILISKKHSREVIKELKRYNVQIIPVFTVSPYNKYLFSNNIKIYIGMIRQTILDLNNFKKEYGTSDLIFWSMPMSPVQMISNLFVKIAKINIFNVELTPQNFSDLAIKCYVKFQKKFSQRNDIFYLSRDDFTKTIFNNFVNIPIERYPQHTDSYSDIFERKRKKKIVVGIFGIQEMYKEGIFSDLINKLLKVNCEVVIQDNKKLVKKNFRFTKNISFFKYEKNISDVFKQIDFGIYFFNPVRYKLLVSGIVNEAISFGLPIIMPKDNLASETQKIYNCELVYNWENLNELFHKIDYTIKNFEIIKKSIISASKTWNNKEGTNKYFRKILQEKCLNIK